MSRSGRTVGAAVLAFTVLVIGPIASVDAADGWCTLASAKLEAGELDSAVELFERALAADPDEKCAVAGLVDADEQRARAAELSTAGESLVESGYELLAAVVFRASYSLDSANAEAVQGLRDLGASVDPYAAARRLDAAGFDEAARDAAVEAAQEPSAGPVPDDLADETRLDDADSNLKSVNSVLGELLKLAALGFGAAAIIAAAIVITVSFCSWPWFDRFRRRAPFLRRFFSPRFRIDEFAGPDTKFGPSVAALVTDEITQAQPGGVSLDKADVDAAADAIASQLSQTLPQAGLLLTIAARFLRFRRYTVRGTVHPPTQQWVSLTVEILDNRQRVLANATIFDDLLDAPEGDPAPYYLLVPATAAWLVYTLYDITEQPSDTAWRRSRWHPTHDKLRLVGTTSWSSYGNFRKGYWLETLDRFDLARYAYSKALHQDRRNVGALINLASLDIRRLDRLDIAIQRLDQVAQLLHDEAESADGPPKADPPRYQIGDLNSARRRRCPPVGVVYGSAVARPPSTQLLWYRVAYLRAVTKLHRSFAADIDPDARSRLVDEAFTDAITLVRAQATILRTFEAPDVPPEDTTEQEGALVELALQSELTALTLVLALTLEAPNQVQLPPPHPQPTHRWDFLATAQRSDLTFERVLGLINPDRPISYQARYNLACAYARRAELLPAHTDADPEADRIEALKHLRVALDGELRLLEWARAGDPALASLRDDPRFEDLMDELDRRQQPPRPTEKEQ